MLNRIAKTIAVIVVALAISMALPSAVADNSNNLGEFMKNWEADIAETSGILVAHRGRCASDGKHYNRKTGVRHNCGKSRKPPANTSPVGIGNESDWTKRFCGGRSEVRNSDGTRTDCLANGKAIEVDFPDKWAEAHGQALRYGRLNNLPGEIWIICGRPKRNTCGRHIPGLLKDVRRTGVSVVCKRWSDGRTMTCPR